MKEQEPNGKDFTSIINSVPEFRRAYDSSRIHQDAAVWPLREFMNGPVFAASKPPSTLTSNDADRRDRTITTYAEVVNHLLWLYATDAVIAKDDEKICILKQGLLAPWDLTIKCGGAYNEQTVRGFLLRG